MSYGPVWYEWSKRKSNDNDVLPIHSEPGTHTRYTIPNLLVTEVYWCQPALYRGAPGFTNTKYRELIATIYPTWFSTNDESAHRVYIRSAGFVEADVLKKAIDYSLSDNSDPDSDWDGFRTYEEYIPGNDYPCTWCGRAAGKDCKGYYDPECVDSKGKQHSIEAAMLEFDSKCYATRQDTLIRKDGTIEKSTLSIKRCYKRPNHSTDHTDFGWNSDIWPTQEIGPWITPTDEDIAKQRADLLAYRIETVEKCRRGEIDARGTLLKHATNK